MCSAPQGCISIGAFAREIGGGRLEAVPGLGCGRSLGQKGCFVGSAVESAFGGKSKDARELWALGGGHEIQEFSRQWRRGAQK